MNAYTLRDLVENNELFNLLKTLVLIYQAELRKTVSVLIVTGESSSIFIKLVKDICKDACLKCTHLDYITIRHSVKHPNIAGFGPVFAYLDGTVQFP